MYCSSCPWNVCALLEILISDGLLFRNWVQILQPLLSAKANLNWVEGIKFLENSSCELDKIYNSGVIIETGCRSGCLGLLVFEIRLLFNYIYKWILIYFFFFNFSCVIKLLPGFLGSKLVERYNELLCAVSASRKFSFKMHAKWPFKPLIILLNKLAHSVKQCLYLWRSNTLNLNHLTMFWKFENSREIFSMYL